MTRVEIVIDEVAVTALGGSIGDLVEETARKVRLAIDSGEQVESFDGVHGRGAVIRFQGRNVGRWAINEEG